MNLSLIPTDPYGCKILYKTISFAAQLKMNKTSAFIYYSYLISGLALSIIVVTAEYACENGLEYLRSDFLLPNRFSLNSWKSQCRTWQLEMAIETIGNLIFDNFNPFETTAYGPLLQDIHYLSSLRTTNQWGLMNEKSEEVNLIKQQLTLRLNLGMDQILTYCERDNHEGLSTENPDMELFISQLSDYYNCLNYFSGYSTKHIPYTYQHKKID